MFEITNILFKITNNSFEIPNILLEIQNILFDYPNISYKISNIFFKIPNISKVPKFRDFSNILLMRPNNLSVILKCIPNKLLEVSNIFYIFSITYCPLMCVCRLPVQILAVTLLKTKIFRIFNKLIFLSKSSGNCKDINIRFLTFYWAKNVRKKLSFFPWKLIFLVMVFHDSDLRTCAAEIKKATAQNLKLFR